MKLSQSVRLALDYDAATGEFRWRSNRANVRAGDVAGNVRVTSASGNGLNRHRTNRNNSSGVLGVCEVKPGRFVAYLTVGRERRHLGTFPRLEDAARAREAALAEAAP